MRADFWFGIAITLCGLSVIYWSIYGGPWMTKFVWLDENSREWVEFFRGDVSAKQLADAGHYQATHLNLKSRVVMRLEY